MSHSTLGSGGYPSSLLHAEEGGAGASSTPTCDQTKATASALPQEDADKKPQGPGWVDWLRAGKRDKKPQCPGWVNWLRAVKRSAPSNAQTPTEARR